MKHKDKSPEKKAAEQIWQEFLKNNGQEWTASMELLPPDAQEDLILSYYFFSFTRIN